MAQQNLVFEGRDVPIEAGDTIASALYRAGVRTFSRSFKYHRRRGLYCVSGDCPNCTVNVDGDSTVRSCVTPARGGQVVHRQSGWPSVEHDALAIADRMHALLPVGFYYKTFIRPRWLWPRAEPLIRRVAGRATIDLDVEPRHREVRHRHPDVLVIGAGPAGLSAAIAAAERGEEVLVADEGQVGDGLATGPSLAAVLKLRETAVGKPNVDLLERAPAVGIYEGPLVPLNAQDALELIHPRRVIVATGAIERHALFQGNDVPGVFLARGAARLAGCHGVKPGSRAVAAIATEEGCEHVRTLVEAGVEMRAVLAPAHLRDGLAARVPVIVDGRLLAVRGRRAVTAAVVECGGKRERIGCDIVVHSLGFVARDGLYCQTDGLDVTVAGDAAQPGCSLQAATASGRAAGSGVERSLGSTPQRATDFSTGGVVCLCEDVATDDLALAWQEGFRSTELLKRYTTTCMGPCQGALCRAHLSAFVAGHQGAPDETTAPTTSRPPARPITIEEAAAGLAGHLQHRTRLHDRHVSIGARMEPAAEWQRPSRYGPLEEEYWAVRSRVSIMDVGTLGKYLVAGPDATTFLERLYPCRVADLTPGRLRYALLLDESGFVRDDGLICALEDGRWYLTFTSGGAAHAEAWLHDWRDQWSLDVHIANRTAAIGAINVAGPHARTLLASLSDDDFSSTAIPYLRHAEVEVAGVPCRAVRLGFVGELSYELHHSSSRSVELWDALLSHGTAHDVIPHGLDTLRLLRLEKSHLIVGQDTDYDSTPAKLGLDWAVKLEKPWFIGKTALCRTAEIPIARRLAAMRFDAGAPTEGAPVFHAGRQVGHLTSSGYSFALRCGVALGWVSYAAAAVGAEVTADGLHGQLCEPSPYDSQGAKLRA